MNPTALAMTYSDSAPRFVDLALLLCQYALQSMDWEMEGHPDWADRMFAWYLQRAAALHRLDPDEAFGDDTGSTCDTEEEQLGEVVADCGGVHIGIDALPSPSHGRPRQPLFQSARVQRAPYESDGKGGGNGGTQRAWDSAPLSQSKLKEEENEEDEGEVSFAAAFAKLRQPTAQKTGEDESAEWTVERAAVPLDAGHSAPRLPGRPRRVKRDAAEAPRDAGFALIVAFLKEAVQTGGEPLGRLAAHFIVQHLLPDAELQTSTMVTDAQTGAQRPLVDITTLAALFTLSFRDEEDGYVVTALGSATRSFLVWVNVAWSCASFTRQGLLARAVSRWVIPLQKCARGNFTAAPGVLPLAVHPEQLQAAHAGQKPPPTPAASLSVETVRDMQRGALCLHEAYEALRAVFEGHAETQRAALDQLLSQTRPSQIAANFVARLLSFQSNPSVALSGAGRANGSNGNAAVPSRGDVPNRSAQPTLFNITCGMLLYVQFYLSLRALDEAEQCARMAVLVGHQLHANDMLALGHYCSFLVHMAAGRAVQAAESITIALQLSVGAAAGDAAAAGGASSHLFIEGRGGVMELHTGSLCFLGAAQLLLFCPDAVGNALRSALMTGFSVWHGGSAAADGGDRRPLSRDAHKGGSGNAANEDEAADDDDGFVSADDGVDYAGSPTAFSEGLSMNSGGAGTAATPSSTHGHRSDALSMSTGSAVVVHSIAQTVRHALWVAEMNSFFRPTSPAVNWLGVVTSIARETVLVTGSIYGLRCCPLHVGSDLVGHLLRQMNEDSNDCVQTSVGGLSGTRAAQEGGRPTPLRPAAALLMELARYVAHVALANEEGTLLVNAEGSSGGKEERARPAVSGKANAAGPSTGTRTTTRAACDASSQSSSALGGMAEFIHVVRYHFGDAGVARVSAHAFFSLTTEYLLCCWLARQGFLAAAYDGLTTIAARLCRVSGMEKKANHTQTQQATSGTVSVFDMMPRAGDSEGRYDSVDECTVRWFSDTSSEATTLFWPTDHLLLYTYVQLKRGELAVYFDYPAQLDAMTAALQRVSTQYHFVYGVLVSHLMELLALQLKGSCTTLLHASEALQHSARAIGLHTLLPRITARQVSALMSSGRWVEAMAALDAMPPVPHTLRAWYALTRLNVGVEVLLMSSASSCGGGSSPQARSSTAAAEDGLLLFVRTGVAALGEMGLLGTEASLLASLNRSNSPTLSELVCAHTAVLRLRDLLEEAAERHRSARTLATLDAAEQALDALAGLLHRRHTRRDGIVHITQSALSERLERWQCGELLRAMEDNGDR